MNVESEHDDVVSPKQVVLHIRHVSKRSEDKQNPDLRRGRLRGTLFYGRIIGKTSKVPQYPTSVRTYILISFLIPNQFETLWDFGRLHNILEPRKVLGKEKKNTKESESLLVSTFEN